MKTVYALGSKGGPFVYVGITSDLRRRFGQHLMRSTQGRVKTYEMMKNAGVSSYNMTCTVLERTEDETREELWRQALTATGHPIQNIQFPSSEANSARQVEAANKRWSSSDERTKASVRMSAIQIEKAKDPAHLEYLRILAKRASEASPPWAAAKGGHTRWHKNRNVVNPSCSFCAEEALS